MFTEIAIGLLSMIGLLVGAEIVIDRAIRIAKKMNVSGFFIGLTVFSIGTSLPEIAVHILSSISILNGEGSFETLSGLVMGMNVGSNLAQITLITGIVTLFGALKANKKFLKVDYMVMLGAIVMLFLFALDGLVSRVEGFVMLASYIVYLWYLAKDDHFKEKLHYRLQKGDRLIFWRNITMLVGGLILLLLSAEQVANLAETYSERYQISGSLLGTLLVGLSTSLPELTTAIIALMRKKTGMSVGTLVGSNITNPLLGIGLGALISTYAVDSVVLWYDMVFNFGISVLLLLVMWRKLSLNRFWGLGLVVAYFVFVLGRLNF